MPAGLNPHFKFIYRHFLSLTYSLGLTSVYRFFWFFLVHFNVNNEKCLWLKSLSNLLLLLYFYSLSQFFFFPPLSFWSYWNLTKIAVIHIYIYLLISFISVHISALTDLFRMTKLLLSLSILTSICDENKRVVFPLTFGQNTAPRLYAFTFFYFIFPVLFSLFIRFVFFLYFCRSFFRSLSFHIYLFCSRQKWVRQLYLFVSFWTDG